MKCATTHQQQQQQATALPSVAVFQECALYIAGLVKTTHMQQLLCYCHATNLMQLCILFWRGTLQQPEQVT